MKRRLNRFWRGPASVVECSVDVFPHVPFVQDRFFLVLLLRRLWLHLPLSSRFCRCGRLLDVLGHHRAGCAEAGVLGRRGFALFFFLPFLFSRVEGRKKVERGRGGEEGRRGATGGGNKGGRPKGGPTFRAFFPPTANFVLSSLSLWGSSRGIVAAVQGHGPPKMTCRLLLAFFTDFFLHLCQPKHLMGRKGWSHMEVPSGWLQVIRGPRPLSTQREVSGRGRQSRGATVTSQVPKPRMSPDAPREKVQSSVARLEKALEAMGDVAGPAVEALKAENVQSQGSGEATCRGRGNRPVSQVQRQVREADQGVGFTTCRRECFNDRGPGASQEVVGSTIARPDSTTRSRVTGDVTPADGQHVAGRTRCFGAGVEDDVHPVTKKQAVARQVSSFRDPHVPVPLMPRHVPDDAMSWLEDRQAESQQALGQGDLMRVTELGKLIAEGVTHLSEITTVQPSSVSNRVTT